MHRALDIPDEPFIRVSLTGVPHRHAAKAAEVFAIIDHSSERGGRHTTGARCLWAGGDTHEHFHVRIGGFGTCPVIPRREIEERLVGDPCVERMDPTRIVVELYEHGVERDVA